MSVDADIPVFLSFLFVIGGLLALAKSADVFVDSASALARRFGISPLIVGMVIIGFGTSAPELLVSAIASAKKGEGELVVGNIVGSNLFNALVVVGLAGTLSPFDGFSGHVVGRDIPVMVAMTLSIAVFGINYRHPRNSGVISRIKGVTWVFAFIAYMALMLMQEAA